MKIVKATYGTKDVTSIVKNNFNNNILKIYISNDLFGDPNPGILKKFVVQFDNGLELTEQENNFLLYPKLNNERLGIFYSNNNNAQTNETIKACLQMLQISSSKSADIITCVWNKIAENPFLELMAQTKNSSHLNQILQMLQILYFARRHGSYKYVSFLEHDCFYPEGYFDYDDFDQDSICNTNYIGLCKNGWQTRKQDDRPLSQVTMKFDSAIEHFENTLPNALVTNSGCVEPWWQTEKTRKYGSSKYLQKKWNSINWSCKNPSVHINHGYHFTSHFTTFSKETIDENYYWGNYLKYSYLFDKK